jgi:Family of unknown function (DUF6498)
MSLERNSSGTAQVDADEWEAARRLLHPSTLFLIAANWVPVFGVLYWGWDVFVLLILYWLETATIGIWTIARIAVAPAGSLGPLMVNGRPTNSRLAMTVFFILHSGMFMGGHLVFLWALFSGDWARKIHDPADFFGILVIGTGLWIPLLLLFVARGLGFLFHELSPEVLRNLERRLGLPPSMMPAAAEDSDLALIGGFYGRIIMMHVTIIFGAFLAAILGSIAPLIIMVLLKTCADVGLHLVFDFDHPRAPRPIPAGQEAPG